MPTAAGTTKAVPSNFTLLPNPEKLIVMEMVTTWLAEKKVEAEADEAREGKESRKAIIRRVVQEEVEKSKAAREKRIAKAKAKEAKAKEAKEAKTKTKTEMYKEEEKVKREPVSELVVRKEPVKERVEASTSSKARKEEKIGAIKGFMYRFMGINQETKHKGEPLGVSKGASIAVQPEAGTSHPCPSTHCSRLIDIEEVDATTPVEVESYNFSDLGIAEKIALIDDIISYLDRRRKKYSPAKLGAWIENGYITFEGPHQRLDFTKLSPLDKIAVLGSIMDHYSGVMKAEAGAQPKETSDRFRNEVPRSTKLNIILNVISYFKEQKEVEIKGNPGAA